MSSLISGGSLSLFPTQASTRGVGDLNRPEVVRHHLSSRFSTQGRLLTELITDEFVQEPTSSVFMFHSRGPGLVKDDLRTFSRCSCARLHAYGREESPRPSQAGLNTAGWVTLWFRFGDVAFF